MRIIHVPHGQDWRAEVIIETEPVSIPTQRMDGKRTIYERAEYTALATRPATEQEVREWRLMR